MGISLQLVADSGKRGHHAGVLDVLADRSGVDPFDIEGHAVVIDRLDQDRAERFADRLGRVLAVAEQIEVARPRNGASIQVTNSISPFRMNRLRYSDRLKRYSGLSSA